VFVESLDLGKLGFIGVRPFDTGRPSHHPGTMLKLYIYGYLNRVLSSRRLERECQRNIEMIWLTGQPVRAPDGRNGSPMGLHMNRKGRLWNLACPETQPHRKPTSGATSES